MNEIERRALLGVAGIGALAALSKAGPLGPPAGAVAPSGRSLDEVYNKIPTLPNGSGDGRIPIAERTTGLGIGGAGSYVLTGNVSVSSGTALTIMADDVTLDLNGYTVSSSANTGTGISVSSTSSGVVIRNGTVRGFSIGVNLSGSSAVVVEDLLINGARLLGITASSTSARAHRVRRCTICDVGGGTTSADISASITGIDLSGGIIEDCVVNQFIYNGTGTPTFIGILVAGNGARSMVARCTVVHSSNDRLTATGIHCGAPALATIFRDNNVLNLSLGFTGGNDGGGNKSS